MTKIEFYVGDAEKHIAVLDSDAVPRTDERINIRKVTYRVVRVTWAIDQFTGEKPQLRANVVLVEDQP